ncbi:UNVERIFIED_CONTAM: hypothetical protein GTU68_011683 [Idotea baltica]|nr:hypothetical protein [Idotea baltica]
MNISKRILLFVLTNLLLIATFTVIGSFFGVEGYVTESGLNYKHLLIFCTVYGFLTSGISLACSRIVAKKFMKIKLINKEEAGNLQWLALMVDDISRRAGLEVTPEVGVYRSDDMNAFATGPTKKRALVAFSSELLQKMDRAGIEGVAAHEIAHIQNGDMVTMTLLQAVVNVFVMFLGRVIAYGASSLGKNESQSRLIWFVTLIAVQFVLGFLGLIVTGWFSRKREFRADAGSAQLVGASSMIKSLEFLQQENEDEEKAKKLPESMAALGISGGVKSLFSTHPALEIRIEALRKLGG